MTSSASTAMACWSRTTSRTPSDIAITTQLKAAGEVVGIELLDHIIFNRSGYWSFLEKGKL